MSRHTGARLPLGCFYLLTRLFDSKSKRDDLLRAQVGFAWYIFMGG